ncbi:hypothetical protein HPB48_000864 [Haemaphysalis longicornis]|uniref:Transmembrane protein n=1 Tax=Haemaphysalis longicornis TaxID=44386 RepID=A0A9J6GCB0_HAELO|nr:hypothetical protein HPB48_000864 [Haemaphysalis longicornis]
MRHRRSTSKCPSAVAVAGTFSLFLFMSPCTEATVTAQAATSSATPYSNRTLAAPPGIPPQPANRATLVASALPATLGLGGLLYGLTVLPALLALFGSSGAFPLTGFLGSLFRDKSDHTIASCKLANTEIPARMTANGPKLTGSCRYGPRSARRSSGDGKESKRDASHLLAVVQEALQRWDGAPEACRSMFVCQVAKEALQAGYLPDMRPFDPLFALFLGDSGGKPSPGKDSKALFPHQTFFHAMRDGFRGCKAKYDCDAPLQPPRYPRTRKT